MFVMAVSKADNFHNTHKPSLMGLPKSKRYFCKIYGKCFRYNRLINLFCDHFWRFHKAIVLLKRLIIVDIHVYLIVLFFFYEIFLEIY